MVAQLLVDDLLQSLRRVRTLSQYVMPYRSTSERGSPQCMMHLYCAAIFQTSEGRFLRLCAWVDAGSAADFAWCSPDMRGE
jgi:hypothetical protein